MTARRRWSLWVLGVALLVAVPLGIRSLPAQGSGLDPEELLRRVQAAAGESYAGYVETSSTLRLPFTDELSGLGSLLGDGSRMRVWWRGEQRWRVDRLETAGETDLIHRGDRTTRWDYERSEASTSQDPDIRLPRTSDLLPPVLADRLVSEAGPRSVTALSPRRVAGVDAAGLRVRPASGRSRVRWVDLWADPETGVPLRVEVTAEGASEPAFVSTFREFAAGAPAAGTTRFTAPPEADTSEDDVLDIADAANRYAPLRPPQVVAGLPASDSTRGAVGVYGGGLAQLIAVPLRGREAGPLREQLTATPGAKRVDQGVVVTRGPLGLMLTGNGNAGGDGGDDEGGWLLAGTVTAATLVDAAADLRRGTEVLRGRQ